MPDDVAEYIARAIKSNVRELEGALIRLMAYASLTGMEINLSTAQQVLKAIVETQEKKVTIEQIQKRVGEHFGLRAQDLKVRSNSKVIAFPRQVAMFLVKQLTSASLPEIGKQFGGKHHTTVLHSINKIETLRHSRQRFEQNDQQATRLVRIDLSPIRRGFVRLSACGSVWNDFRCVHQARIGSDFSAAAREFHRQSQQRNRSSDAVLAVFSAISTHAATATGFLYIYSI